MNREQIGRLISFENEEGADSSTGYVNVGNDGQDLTFYDPGDLTVFMQEEFEKLPEIYDVKYYFRGRQRTPATHKIMLYVEDGGSKISVSLTFNNYEDFKTSMERLFFRTTVWYSDSYDSPAKSSSLFSERSLNRLKYLADHVRLIES